jgi:hypothetical protein
LWASAGTGGAFYDGLQRDRAQARQSSSSAAVRARGTEAGSQPKPSAMRFYVPALIQPFPPIVRTCEGLNNRSFAFAGGQGTPAGYGTHKEGTRLRGFSSSISVVRSQTPARAAITRLATVGTFVGSLGRYRYRSAPIARGVDGTKVPVFQPVDAYRTLPTILAKIRFQRLLTVGSLVRIRPGEPTQPGSNVAFAPCVRQCN